MPKMSGVEVARAIRHFYGETRPVLIGISGRHEMFVISRYGEMFDDFLQKPVDIADLLPLVETRVQR
jgi:DNA-binding response OmpR family regulator